MPTRSSSSSGSAPTGACCSCPGEMFGIENGIRFGFGFDIEHTLKGLALVGETLAEAAAGL